MSGGNANTTCTQGGSVIDDVMNVICTDKNGKFKDMPVDDEKNPKLIDKIVIPEKTNKRNTPNSK